MKKEENSSFPFVSSQIAIFTAIIYLLLRFPLETDYAVVIKCLGLTLFIINAPFVATLFFERLQSVSFYSLNVTLVISFLLLLILAGTVNVSFLGYPLALAGIVSFGISASRHLSAITVMKCLSSFFILILCLWLTGSVWEGRVLSPLTFEKIIAGFYNNPNDLNYGLDNLYHMSIAQMIKTYNVPSTGLDELPYIPYHFGSHYVFAQISNVLSISIPDIYNVGYPIIFLPLFFHLAFIIFQQFRELGGQSEGFDLLFWILVFTIFVGFLSIDPTGFAYRTGLAWNSLIKSESYLISLMFLFVYLSIFLIPLLRNKLLDISWYHVAVLTLVLVVIGFCKISTLFILDLVIGYSFLRYKLFNSRKGIVVLVSSTVISVSLAYLLHDPKGTGGAFEFLHFYNTFIYSRFHFFIALYFLWTFALLATCGILYILKIPFSTVPLELQLLMAVIGFLPGMLMKVEGGSAHYFSDIQHWTAFLFMGYYGSLVFQKIRKRVTMRITWGIGMLFILLGIMNCVYSFKMLAKDNYLTKEVLLGGEIRHVSDVSTGEMLDNPGTFTTPALRTALTKNPEFAKLAAIVALDTLSQKQKRILYIEDEQWLINYFPCFKSPFLLSGVTGISLLNGFSLDDCYWGGYGVEYYTEFRSLPPGQNLCEVVKSPVFEEVISYNINNKSYKVISCKK